MSPEFTTLRPAELALLLEDRPAIARLARLTVGDLIIRGWLSVWPNHKAGPPHVKVASRPGRGNLREFERPYLFERAPGTHQGPYLLSDYLRMVFGERPQSSTLRRGMMQAPELQPYFRHGFLYRVLRLERLSAFGDARADMLRLELSRLAELRPADSIDNIDLHLAYGGNVLLLRDLDPFYFQMLDQRLKRRRAKRDGTAADTVADAVGDQRGRSDLEGHYEPASQSAPSTETGIAAIPTLMGGGRFGGGGAGGSWAPTQDFGSGGNGDPFDEAADASGADTSGGDSDGGGDGGGDSGCGGCGGCGGCS